MNSLRKSNYALLLLSAGFVSFFHSSAIFAHGSAHDHDPKVKAIPAEDKNAGIAEQALQTMQTMHDEYKQNIEVIFRKKCFDCHSDRTEYPWYYKVPGIKQWIDSDIREAREHLDMSAGFPFTSKHSIDHDLEEIEEVLDESSMPPKSYVFVHSASKVRSEEKAVVKEWITKSRKALQEEAREGASKH